MTVVRVSAVAPMEGFKVELEFTDGKHAVVDLEPYLSGPIFEPLLSDRLLYLSVRVDPELGTIVWSNGADIDPEVLSGRRQPVEAESAATS